jgi:hypothetical protein
VSVPTYIASEELDDVGLLVDDPCGDGPCADVREVWIDYDALGVEGMRGGEWIRYDYDEVTRPVTAKQLPFESEPSLAVRLIISEVGADRMLTNRWAVLEGIGILYTVDNRLDPVIYNPQDDATAPDFPGCGPNGSFGACANPEQYLGMATWRALDPGKHYAPDLLEPAVDLAVTAWWLQEHGYVADFTGGATNYVHRCGAAAYGMTTPHCDAHLGRPAGDVPGANPYTGPIVFKGPTVYNPHRGVYPIEEYRRIEYDPWWDVTVEDDSDALADAAEGNAADLAFDVVLRVPAFVKPDPIAADAQLGSIVSAIGAPTDLDTLRALIGLRQSGW